MDLFGLDQKPLIEELLGRPCCFQGRWFYFLELQGYPRAEKGVWAPMKDMVPGTVYWAVSQSKMMTVISSLDRGRRGGGILVRGIELTGGQRLQKPAHVSDHLGVTKHGTTGSLETQNDGLFVLRVDGQPPIVQPTNATPARQPVLTRHMAKMIKAYNDKRASQPTLTFEAFLKQCAACPTEAALKELLR